MLAIAAAIAAAALTFRATIDNPSYTYLTWWIVFPMINAGVFSATIVAAGCFLYGSLLRPGRARGE